VTVCSCRPAAASQADGRSARVRQQQQQQFVLQPDLQYLLQSMQSQGSGRGLRAGFALLLLTLCVHHVWFALLLLTLSVHHVCLSALLQHSTTMNW
jgi:hypothetical protein